MQDTPIPSHDRLDLAGIAISGACLIHCLATPMLIAVIPLAGEIFASAWVHLSLATALLPLAAFSLVAGYRRHRRLRSLTLGAIGVFLIFCVLFCTHLLFPTDHCCLTSALSPLTIMNLTGSASLVAAHALNIRDGFHPCDH
jgi:hypothetical protein